MRSILCSPSRVRSMSFGKLSRRVFQVELLAQSSIWAFKAACSASPAEEPRRYDPTRAIMSRRSRSRTAMLLLTNARDC